MNALKQTIKSTAKGVATSFVDFFKSIQQEQTAYQQAQQQANLNYLALSHIYQIQFDLAYILRQARISRLQPIRYLNDFLPCGYIIRPDNSFRAYFLWTKANPDDVFASAVLDSMTEKMNLIIKAQISRHEITFQRLNPYEKLEFLWQHPTFNYGFHVTGCKDNGDDIILEVAFGFPA